MGLLQQGQLNPVATSQKPNGQNLETQQQGGLDQKNIPPLTDQELEKLM
jgi:hypothetical protein